MKHSVLGSPIGPLTVVEHDGSLVGVYMEGHTPFPAYDTIYALQDREDDALVGVRSTARLFADKWRTWTSLFYILALAFWAAAGAMSGAGIWVAAPLSLIHAGHRHRKAHKMTIGMGRTAHREAQVGDVRVPVEPMAVQSRRQGIARLAHHH